VGAYPGVLPSKLGQFVLVEISDSLLQVPAGVQGCPPACSVKLLNPPPPSLLGGAGDYALRGSAEGTRPRRACSVERVIMHYVYFCLPPADSPAVGVGKPVSGKPVSENRCQICFHDWTVSIPFLSSKEIQILLGTDRKRVPEG
jgi:hypothetical protein